MTAHDLKTALTDIASKEVRTAADDDDAFPRLAKFNDGAIYVGRFSGESPWECHPGADELLHILEGEVDITLLTEPEPTHIKVRAGSVIVVPKGLWHRQIARPSVTLLAATPDWSETSFAEDPRRF